MKTWPVHLAVLASVCVAPPARAQSLGELARAEAARREAIVQPARVFTNADLAPHLLSPIEPSAPRVTPVAVTETAPVPVLRTDWKPVEFRAGALPVTPVQAIAGGQVFVQATVTAAGRVGDVATLRTSPLFTDAVLDVIRGWEFRPAEQTVQTTAEEPGSIVTRPVVAKVFVACIFRPPTLDTSTLGEPPTDVGVAADDVAFPLQAVTPLYPPLAQFDGTVLVRVTVGITGSVRSALVLRSVPGFDESAVSAAEQWFFRPARVQGLLEETFAYLAFAFRQPVTLQPVTPQPVALQPVTQ